MQHLTTRINPVRAWLAIILLAAAWPAVTPAAGDGSYTDLDLAIVMNPADHSLDVSAKIVLPDVYAGREIEFLLTDAVDVVSAEPKVTRLEYDGSQGFTGINGSSVDLTETGHVARYRVKLPPGGTTLTMRYRGAINFALGDQREQYARGFRSTAGIVGDEGVFLAGSSLWYPHFSNDLVTFRMDSNVPQGWHLISQGNGTSRDERGRSSWDSAGPVDDIYLVGGPLKRYAEPAGAVTAEVYLREPDDALAQRYLTATAQYIEMYRGLIGPYPYGKFALVENFWETGYGMPSFTLLGPQVIRFPFILTSSYPHEILHNWWGNSVFVDYESGNWCEGLTAYMADHLMQELRGQGAAYRRDTLKKYRDFVKEGRDFPLTGFRSRHSAATEAVGYGKTMMGFHMLRRQIGDDKFRAAMARFYRSNRGRQAGFGDVREAIEAVTGRNFATFFEQWVERTGAVDLELADVKAVSTADGFRVDGALRQVQAGDAYRMTVPVYVTTPAGVEIIPVELRDATERFAIELRDEPLSLAVDPEFDVFRLLDPRETAPSIGQIFGEPAILAVMPSGATPEQLQAYRELADSWQSDAHRIEIVFDTELDRIPAERAAWLFGRDNRLAPGLFDGAGIDVTVGEDALTIGGQRLVDANHAAVIVRRHPANPEKAVGWITVDPLAAFPGMAAKLPHYGKYSYLGFEGEEPANVLKGEWTASDSPLRVDLRPPAAGPAPGAAFPERNALAELPSVFSRDRLSGHVEYLASPALEGRGLGTPGLERAAEYIVEQFRDAGLAPGADGESYSQVFRVDEGEDGRPHDVRNIIGVLPGTDPGFSGQAVLVTAHYDHLGHGWPDQRADAGDSVYYGADDNASGVAVLIELARAMAREAAPKRSVVFVAFTAEEAGLIGSKYYAENPQPYALDGIRAVVNMDTVGGLEDGQDISVIGANTASEWPPVFRGVGFTTGIGAKMITIDLPASDQQSFIDRGIPAVQIFTGATLNYHRPSDTPDKVDADGLLKVAMFVKEAVGYLAERPEPLTATIDTSRPAAPRDTGQQGERRVSVGTVPDFAFAGTGVRMDSVVPGSPAANAGFVAGDVLIRLNEQPVGNLQAYTDLLRTLKPGQQVPATVLRDGRELTRMITVVAR